MRKIRIKSYLIDFFILFLALTIINLIIPRTEYLNTLETEQNAIIEDYMGGRIEFSDYVENYGALYYESSMEQQLNYLVYLLFMILYFVIIPFFWKGRTLGCYQCKVQIERFDQGRLYMWQLLVRYSVVFGIGYIFLNNILLLFLSSKYYFPIISIIAIFQFVLALFSATTVLIHSEKRGLHELISNTEITRIINKPKRRDDDCSMKKNKNMKKKDKKK